MTQATTIVKQMLGTIGPAIALRLLATLLFALMSLSVRVASVEAPVGQIVLWCSAAALIPILAYLGWHGQLREGLKTARPFGHVKRSLYGCVSMYASFVAIAKLPLALASALDFLAPLVAVPMAVLLLREQPRPLVIGATLAPFEYTAIIWALLFDLAIFALWPKPISLLGVLLAVLAAASVAFADRIGAWLKGVPA